VDRRGVRETYDRIASHFSETREHAWPDVREFITESAPCAVALDLGCGNGRHAELLADRADRVVGVDLSGALLEEAHERAHNRGFGEAFDPVQGEAAALPLVADSVDLAVYIATLHHLPSRADRLESLDELARVLVPDGRALVSAWSSAAGRFEHGTGDTTVDWTLPDGTVVGRFYHIYDPAEFERDLADSDLGVVETSVAEGNCYGVVRTRD
jgi:ubiquinone/menaquinone biosynthesis C-methylase UbiE